MLNIFKNNLIVINKFLIFGIVLNLIGTTITIVIPLSVKNFIDFRHSGHINGKWIFIIIIITIAQVIFLALGTFFLSKEGDKQTKEIRLRIKKHLLSIPASYYDDINSSELASRLINDTNILRTYISSKVPQFINSIIYFLVVTIVLFILDWKLSIIILLIFPINMLLIFPIGKINEKIIKQAQYHTSKVIGITTENLSSIKLIKLTNAQEYSYKKFRNEVLNLYKTSIKLDKILSLTFPLQKTINFLLILVVILYGSFRIKENSLTIGELTSFMIFLFQLIGPINNISIFYRDTKEAEGSLEQILSLLSIKSEDSQKKSKYISKFNSIELKNISFSYRDKLILKNINLSLGSGEKIAFVGPSGAGKSTLINIITRLYTFQEGELLLNNTNSKKIPLSDWRSYFTVVLQENTILSGSIRDNLIFGLDYLPTDQQIDEALFLSCLKDEIKYMENGLETKVGESGKMLSGGQRQRLEIARAILRKSEILIFDEATSNLDTKTEEIIINNVKSKIKDITIISIAHRLSTILDADTIYFVNNNKIESKGTHDELLKVNHDYHELVKKQFNKD